MNPIIASNPPNMNLSQIRTKFPFGDRVALKLNCCKRQETPAEILRNIPPMLEF